MKNRADYNIVSQALATAGADLARASSLSEKAGFEGFAPYKELYANSYNRDCKAKVCLWAKCPREDRVRCPRREYSIIEYRLLKDAGFFHNACIGIGAEKAQKLPTERDEQREFLRSLGRGSSYKGLGLEAENCGKFATAKECDEGHITLKKLVCGREWCPYCGEDHSEFHHRRMTRLLPRVFSMDSVGYLVFGIRLSQRSFFHDVVALRAARRYLHRLLRRRGIKCGVSRWHFYGEATEEDFLAALDYTRYHPHLNVLCESGYIPLKKLRRIRILWSMWLDSYCGMPGGGIAPVYYAYSREPGKKYNWVKYVTRPTFKKLNQGNRHIASELFSFNNCSWFGGFTPEKVAAGLARLEAWRDTLPEKERHEVASVAAHESFCAGQCVVCGAETHDWEGIQRVSSFSVIHDYGGGLYYVKYPDAGRK